MIEDWPDVDLPAIKSKKSQGTGSGVKDVYISKWTFFEECSFLDEVIRAKHNTMTNVEEFLDYHVVDNNPDTATETECVRVFRVLQENEANELRDLAQVSSTEEAEDEWNILKKDVANSMRNLGDRNLKEK
ncbi:hypothetical protein P5673_027058 [Acropora cervicornis]|uniref:Uncharacterized protein n=1 Tax=Acropora cervicornis TaxID=6130 RepID=A0AAD9Q056_ACRCE|nr:hypothetical protein P5673_027058 [Acropora cervicornis]